jgi:hypothetical protein
MLFFIFRRTYCLFVSLLFSKRGTGIFQQYFDTPQYLALFLTIESKLIRQITDEALGYSKFSN